MGFLKRIGHKFHKAKHIGSRIAHVTAIGLRKGGNTIKRVAEIAGKAAPYIKMAGAIDPRLKGLGELAEEASHVGKQMGDLVKSSGRGFEQASKGEYKNALETGVGVAKQISRFKA